MAQLWKVLFSGESAERRWRCGFTAVVVRPMPQNLAAGPPERQSTGIEVLRDGPQGVEVVDTEDEVKPAQVEPEASDGEVLLTNAEGDVVRNTFAREAVPIGDHDAQITAIGHR
jgi:hypothetical protein